MQSEKIPAPYGLKLDGTPRKSRAGRKPGKQLVPDIDLANTTVREIFFEAFNRLGGLEGLVKWGRKDPKGFYTLFKAMGPRSSASAGPAGPGRPLAGGPRREQEVDIDFGEAE